MTQLFFDERQIIMEELNMIKEERRHQNVRMEELRARLAELDKQNPHASVTYQKQQEFTAAFNKFNEALELMQSTMDKIVPELTMEQIMDIRKKDIAALISLIEETTTTTTRREFTSVEQENDSVTTLKRQFRDLEKESHIVASILKANGGPISTSKLKQILETDHDITYSNLSSSMNRMMEYEPSIERLVKGTYQFNTSKRS